MASLLGISVSFLKWILLVNCINVLFFMVTYHLLLHQFAYYSFIGLLAFNATKKTKECYFVYRNSKEMYGCFILLLLCRRCVVLVSATVTTQSFCIHVISTLIGILSDLTTFYGFIISPQTCDIAFSYMANLLLSCWSRDLNRCKMSFLHDASRSSRVLRLIVLNDGISPR